MSRGFLRLPKTRTEVRENLSALFDFFSNFIQVILAKILDFLHESSMSVGQGLGKFHKLVVVALHEGWDVAVRIVHMQESIADRQENARRFSLFQKVFFAVVGTGLAKVKQETCQAVSR